MAHPGHNFIAAYQHSVCTSCGVTVCKMCAHTLETTNTETGKKKKNPYCCSCAFVESQLPSENASSATGMSMRDMQRELKEDFNWDKVHDLPPDEIEDAWLTHEFHRSLADSADKVEFPLLPASVLNSTCHWTCIGEIDFSQGGSFITAIDDGHVPAVLELFAHFVELDTTGHKRTEWLKDPTIFSVVPKMYIDMVSKCRHDSGYRLLKRMLRHAYDSRTESLDDQSGKLIMYDGAVGIHLSPPIPASMKKEVYSGETVVTKDKLVVACCDCMSGGNKNDPTAKKSSACVHTPVRAFLLTMLLYQGLAQHIMAEFASKVTTADVETSIWNADQIKSMKNSIRLLVAASGDLLGDDKIRDDSTIYDMLESYRTGTQRSKEWNRANGRPREE